MHSQNVLIRDKDRNELGIGSFVCKGTYMHYYYQITYTCNFCVVNIMYGKVLLIKNTCKTDIDLPKAVNSKTVFKELKVRTISMCIYML